MKALREPRSIVLYTRPLCSWCMDAKNWLDKMGWPYTARDTGKDPAAREMAAKISGQPLVPVIEVDGLVLGDFDVADLEKFLEHHGYLG